MPPHNMRQPKTVWKIASLIGAVLIGFLLAEMAVRLRQYYRFGAANSSLYEMRLDPASGLKVPVSGQNTSRIQIDSRGFRNPEPEMPKPAGRLRLAFLGASTTFCAEATSNAATWPHLVREKLQSQWPRASFDYVNTGVPGYRLNHILTRLQTRVAPLQPDVIVIYEATNDLSQDTRELARQQGLFTGNADEPSWLGRYSLAWYLIEKNMQLRATQAMAESGKKRLTYDPKTLSKGYETRLRALIEAAQQTGRLVAVATFSHKARRDQTPAEQLKACNTSLFYMPYMSVEGLLAGFEEYNRVIRAVARETGALLIEGEETIPGDDRNFLDSVHFTDAGNQMMAERVAQALIAAPQMNSLIGSGSSSR